MSLPRSQMRQYDELALDKANWPEGAVEIKKNPETISRLAYIWYDASGEPMCSAKRAGWTPDNPIYCSSQFLMPNGRCKKHGGVTGATGLAHHNYQHGRYSKNLPSALASKYEEAKSDPELHSLDSEIALMGMKISSLLEQASEGGAEFAFKEIKLAWKQLQSAARAQDKDKQAEAARHMAEAINAGNSEFLIWEQINRLVDQRRKLTLAEGKRKQMLEQYITIEQMNLVIAMVLAIVNREVHDNSVLAKVVEGLGRITGRRVPEKALPPAINVEKGGDG